MILKKLLAERILGHVSSLTLFIIFLVMYLYDGNSWLNAMLPYNGKPLAIFTMLGISVVYELNSFKLRIVTKQLEDITREVRVSRLMGAVNSMYESFIKSGEQWITNDYTIKELGDLNDLRDELNVNSYTQGKLEFLTSKIKRS